MKPILAGQRKLRRSASISRWGILGVMAVALPLGAFAWWDRGMVLSPQWRWTGFVLWLAGVIWMIARAGKAFRIPAQREITSLLDGHAALKHGYVISTAVEIDAPRTDKPEEAALLARLHSEAGRLASETVTAHPRPRLWQVTLACLGVVLVGSAGPFPVARLLQPWKELPYTTITLVGPERKPIEREPFTVIGQVNGRVPKNAVLQVSGGVEIPVIVEASGAFRHTFTNGVLAPVTFVARGAEDGISAPLAITFRDLPHPEVYDHRITPPSYTRRPEFAENQAAFSVLRGSKIHYGVVFNRETTGVKLVFDDNEAPVELTRDASRPLAWGADLPVLKRTVGYHLEAIDGEGVWRQAVELAQIVVMPDKPPVVDLGAHNETKLKSPHDTFAMDFKASDDIGLMDVRVRYQRVGDKEWKEKVIRLSEPGTRQQSAEWKLPLDELGVVPHDMVAVVIQARDGNTVDGPGKGSPEPILIEVPEEPKDKDEHAGGGGGGGGESQQVNPLDIQRQIYRDTLRLSVGRQAPSAAELVRRQEENVKNLQEMADKMAGQAPPIFAGLLENARKSAVQATEELQMLSYRHGNFQPAMEKQSAVIDALVKAARIQAEQQQQGGGGEGGQPATGKQFTLNSPNSKSAPSPEEQKERLEQALADLRKLLKEQEDLNKQMGQQPNKGQQPGQQGQQGSSPGGQSQGSGAPDLAARQQDARAQSERIRGQLESLQKSENGGDPALAAEQMKQAERQQQAAAAAIARGSAMASRNGEASSAALEKARQLAESLQGQTPGESTEAETRAPGYQHLIQEYSRRLSYDQ
ncbi:DUF4175 family protein [Luteolibacter sp. LG18]|uniref:DUF4175 family protein n=1 Tax=Luteolibacter sp. LG18 TaxID=2819286 RepID=UPI0030C6FA6F